MRGIFEVMTAGGPVAPISETRERALAQLGYEPVTPQVLQRYGITQDQLDAYFKPARDARSLQRLLESFLDKIYEDGSELAIDMLDSIDDPSVRKKILSELSSLVLHVTRSHGLRVPFPDAIAEGALRSHFKKIAPTAPRSDTLSLFVEVPELTDRELEYLRLDRSDITADMKKEGVLLAIQRLHGSGRDKITDMGKDEAEVEHKIRQELKKLGLNDRRQIVFKLLGAIRNAKIKKNKVLDKNDERWLGATPEKVMDRANYFMDQISPDESKAPSPVGEVDYQTVESDAKAFITTLKKLKDYTATIQTMNTGEYGSSNEGLQQDIVKIQNFKKPEIPEHITGPLAKEIDRLSKTPAHRKVLEDMIDPFGQVQTDPESIKKKYQYANAALLARYKKIRDRKPGEPYTLPIPSVERYTPEGRFLRTQLLEYMSRTKSGDALKALEDTLKDVQDRISAADDLQAMKGRGELSRYEQLSGAFTKNISDEMSNVASVTDAPVWEGVIDLMHMLYSQLSTLFEKTDVVAHLKPLWDHGTDILHRTKMDEVDKGFEGIFDQRKNLGDVALSRATKDKNPAILLGYLAREPLLKYISHKLFMLEREPLKHLKGPSFDQTAKRVSSFLQGTSRAMSALNPTSLRRKALKNIFKLEGPDVEIDTGKSEAKKAPAVTEKKAVCDILRAAAVSLLGGKAEDVAILRKRFKTEKAPDVGHFRKRPSKLFGQVTLHGFFDQPDHVKGFVKAIEDRSKMLVDAALKPDDPKHLKKADPEEYKKKMGIDGLVAEVMGVEEKNIEDVLLRRRFTSMMDERLEKSSKGFFDRDPETGKTKARLEKEKVADKIKGIQDKYLPRLNAMAQILSNPFPAIKRALDGMSPDRRKEYEEAIGKLQNLTPEEKEKALEAMRGKSEALGLMDKEHRFLSKNVLAPLMEGTLVKKAPISDEEYNAAARDFKEIVARRGVKRPKDEEESPASFENFKKKLDHSIQMLFSPQAYSHSIIKDINVSRQVEAVLLSDPVRYDFDPKSREELMTQLIKRHRALLQIIDEKNKIVDKNLKTLTSHKDESELDKETLDSLNKNIDTALKESGAVEKLEAEVISVLDTLHKVESEYHTKIKEAPLATIIDRAKDVLDYKLQPPDITMEDIDRTKNPEIIGTYLRKIESYRDRLSRRENDIAGYRKRLSSLKWDKATWGKTPGVTESKEKIIDDMISEEKFLQDDFAKTKKMIKVLNEKRGVKVRTDRDEKPIVFERDNQIVGAIKAAKSMSDIDDVYGQILKYRDDIDKTIDSIVKVLSLKGIRKEAAKVIDRPSKPSETLEVDPFVPKKEQTRSDLMPEEIDESRLPSMSIRKMMKNLFPNIDWEATYKDDRGTWYVYDNQKMESIVRERKENIKDFIIRLIERLTEIVKESIKKCADRLKDFKLGADFKQLDEVGAELSGIIGYLRKVSDTLVKDKFDLRVRSEVSNRLSSLEKECGKVYDKFRDIRDQYYKSLPQNVRHTPSQPVSPTPSAAPGMFKTAAIEDVQQSDPETALRETTKNPSVFYDEEATRLKEMELLEYLYEGVGEELSRLRELSKSEYVKKDAIEARIEKLEQTVKKLGKLQAIEVPVLGKNVPLKEIPYEFDTMTDDYFNAMAQARAQMKNTEERVAEAKKRIGEIEQYYDPETGEYKITDAEKRSVMDIFYQGLFWAMQNYWNQQLGKGTKEGERDLYFGERTQEPFWKIYETFKALGGVKSNPVYQKLLKTGDALLRADIDDTKHRTMKGAYLDEMKKMNKRWVDLGYTKKEIVEAKKRNPYKHFEEQVEYLDSVKRQQNLVFRAIREVSDAKYVNHILGEIAKKTKDDELRATVEKRQKEILGEVKSDSTKNESVQKEVDVDPEDLKKAVIEAENIISGKNGEPAEQIEKSDVNKVPKTAYDRSHPDFDLKILYGSVMQKTIAEMLLR